MDQFELENIKHELSLGQVSYLPSTGSTNDIAKDWLMNNADHFSIVVADEQTQGKGRSGRRWHTPPHSALAFSLVFSENIFPEIIFRYSGLGSLAVCETLSKLTNSLVEIKWPNDILIEKRKVGGVLVESYWVGENLKGLVLGIGINVFKASLPPETEINFPATFLDAHTSKPTNRTELLKQILLITKEWYQQINMPGFIKAWDQKLAFKGELVQLLLSGTETIEGRLEGLTHTGEIIIGLSNGRSGHFNASEIKLRPA